MSVQTSNTKEKRINTAITASVCALLFLVGCNPSLEAVNETSDQATLARIAVADKHSVVREAAVLKLTDQATLARIAMEDKDEDVREAAVLKLTDQATLARIAVADKHSVVREAAVLKLTDQATLTRIAVANTYSDVREAARKKITDQTSLAMWEKPELTRQVTDQALLADIAVEAGLSKVREAAVLKLTDQATLAKIAMEDKDEDVREAAISNPNLTDQTVLARAAVDEKRLTIRLAAIAKVTDQIFVRQWAENDPQAAIRQAAVTRIEDDRFLVQRLGVESSPSVRSAIVQKLHEKESLSLVALSAYHQNDRMQALLRLKRISRDLGYIVETKHKALARRVSALATEKNNNKLLQLSLEGEFDVLRTAAARRLSDHVTLEHVASQAMDREVLKILLPKLVDKDMLNRVAANANDRAMRLAAEQKRGAKSWGEIFDTASAKGATTQMLGDALAAVSLFPMVQRDAESGVQNAALNLIRRGDESRIPEMVDLLAGYGDKTLGEDYLNCGQPDLDAAGRRWARSHGYNVGSGDGSHRAAWGRGR